MVVFFEEFQSELKNVMKFLIKFSVKQPYYSMILEYPGQRNIINIVIGKLVGMLPQADFQDDKLRSE